MASTRRPTSWFPKRAAAASAKRRAAPRRHLVRSNAAAHTHSVHDDVATSSHRTNDCGTSDRTMYDCGTVGSGATGPDDAPGADHSIRFGRLDSHGSGERGNGEGSEYEYAHRCFLPGATLGRDQSRLGKDEIALRSFIVRTIERLGLNFQALRPDITRRCEIIDLNQFAPAEAHE